MWSSGQFTDLNYRVVVFHTIEASIPICPVDARGIATKVHCHETADASGTHPTAEGFGFYSAWGVPATERADRVYKSLVT
jgi:hypothetical protein